MKTILLSICFAAAALGQGFGVFPPPAGASTASLARATSCTPTSASATAYVCATSPATATCSTGMEVQFVPDVTSGAAPTLDVGCGAKAIRDAQAGAAVPTGWHEAGYPARLRYDGTYWRSPGCIDGASGNKCGNGVYTTTVSATTSISAPRHLLQCTAGTGGVTANTLVKFSGATCVALAASTDGIVGIARFSASAGVSADIVTTGSATCVAEGSITAGNWLIAGTTTPSRCKDSGQSAMRALALSVPTAGVAAANGTDGNNVSVWVTGVHRVGGKSDAIMQVGCNGTVNTANATAYVLGNYNTNGNCNGLTVIEFPFPVAVTASRLYCRASAAGGQAGSGVVSLYKNGSASALTCTLGTGTSCSDTTNSVSFVPGTDTHSVRVLTGQANDTTANVRCTFTLTEN